MSFIGKRKGPKLCQAYSEFSLENEVLCRFSEWDFAPPPVGMSSISLLHLGTAALTAEFSVPLCVDAFALLIL
jgi:hypothetical protein